MEVGRDEVGNEKRELMDWRSDRKSSWRRRVTGSALAVSFIRT